MKTGDAFWQFLPEGLNELFEMVRFEKTDQSYDIWLDEKKKLSDEDYRNPNIVARGYTDYVTVQDYPMRGRPVYLHMRKNKWWDKGTNEIFSYNLELPNEEGTRLSAEFVAFLKVFRLCANSLKRNKTTLGYYFRRIQSRCGYSQAIVATAHKIAKIFFTMVKTHTEYDESKTGINEKALLERKIVMTQRRLDKLNRQLEVSFT